MGTITFSPLYFGVLKGKYLMEIPSDFRYLTNREIYSCFRSFYDEFILN